MLLRASARPGAIGVISGSQPPGVPVDFPERLASSMPGLNVVLDTSGAPLRQAVSHPIPGLFVLRMDGEEAEKEAGHLVFPRRGEGQDRGNQDDDRLDAVAAALDRDDKAATGILDQLAVRDRAAIKQMDDPRTDIRQHRGERHDHMALNRPRQFGDKQDHKQDEKQHDEAKHGGSDVSAKDAV